MREILFRGKRKDNYQEVEGFLSGYEKHIYIIEIVNGLVANWHEVIPKTVGQYTGLTDKNGKRIFEGDIVKHYNRMQEPEAYDVGCIYYDDVHCKWRRTETDDADKFNPEIRAYAKYEVIGNIHDNPELIMGVKGNG